MLRTMMLFDVPLMRMPKFAFEPSMPRMVMLFLPLIDNSCAGLLHWPQMLLRMACSSNVPL